MCMNQVNRALALVVSVVVCVSVAAAAQKPEDGTKKLTMHRGGQPAGATELLLLPKPQELADADAFPLYVKAVKSVPKDFDWGKVKGWRQTPASQSPKDEVGSMLQKMDASLRLLEQAGKWPQTLDELKASLPSDPVVGKPFTYKRLSDTQATLDGPPAPGGDAKDRIGYELNLAK